MSIYANAAQHAAHNGAPAFTIGQRVESHPGTSRFMRGDRYGNVEKVGRELVHVRMDKSGQLVKFHPSNVSAVS